MTRAAFAIWQRIFLAFLITSGISSAFAATPTTTSLNVSSNNVAAGTPVTLTASTMSGAIPVTTGLINFCDASAPRCEDSAIIASGWMTKAGNATIHTVFGVVGNQSITAVFKGTTLYGASTSNTAVVTVTAAAPKPPSIVPLATSTTFATGVKAQGNYNYTGTVTTTGAPGPTGTISFLDASSGNYLLGTATLGTPVLTYQDFGAIPGPVTTNKYLSLIAVGDLNNDGFQDFVVTGTESPWMATILLGNGDGTFRTSPTTYLAGSNPEAVAIADFNGDGNLDIVFTDSNGNGLTVLIGHGDGTFTTVANPVIPGFGWGGAMAVGDFDGDGIPDLVVTSLPGGPIQAVILLGNGDGTYRYGSSTIGLSASSYGSVVVGDFNGDGRLDVALTTYDTYTPANYSYTILLGNGDGTLQTGNTTYTATGGSFLSGDFNGDGRTDLVFSTSTTATILLSNGDGTFTAAPPLPNGNGYTLGDFNRDGKLDILIENTVSNYAHFTIMLGNGDGTFLASTAVLPFVLPPSAIASGDFNGDGMLDMAMVIRKSTITTPTIVLQGANTISTATATASNIFVYSPSTDGIVATYSGDSTYMASQSSESFMWGMLDAPTISLAVTPATATPVSTVQITASIVPGHANNYLPSGTVSFFDGVTLLGTAPISVAQSTFSTSGLSLGVHALSAVYGGGGAFAAATSPTNNLAVRLNPTITWASPAPIAYGTTLNATQFNATASVPGTFVYTPATGTMLLSGTRTLSVTFNPNDTTDYNNAATTVSLMVAPSLLTVSANSFSRAVGAANASFTGKVTGVVNNDLVTGSLVVKYSTTAGTGSPVGSYPITAALNGPAAASYALTVNTATLSVWSTGVDLIESGVSVTGTPATGGTIQVADTATNQGIQGASASYTMIYLSTDGKAKGSMLAYRSVPALASGASFGATTTMTLPTNITGTNYVLVCANNSNSPIVESNTANNCTASAAFTVAGADLIESSVTGPTSGVVAGGNISVIDTTTNQGGGAASASYTMYYLSTDGKTKGAMLTYRSVAALAAGAGSSVTTSMMLPTNITGTNYVLVCANNSNSPSVESNTANNCTASAAFTVAGADLIESSVTGPTTGVAGGTIFMTDTTMNQGGGAASASYTMYYLSTDGKTKGSMLTYRSVAALAAGAGSSVTTSMMLPTNIIGANYVMVCANGSNSPIAETNTANDCTASVAFTVAGPDLIESSITGSASGVAGGTISMTDTTTNQGLGATSASYTMFYLSIDGKTKGAMLTYRSVVGLAAGSSSSATTSLTLPANITGTNYVLVCANGSNSPIVETNYSNDCTASAAFTVAQ